VAARILIVDDELLLREVMTDVLQEAGYVVTACANGREALAEVNAHPQDAVISDVKMPDMDGLQLLRAVRERHLDLPFVLLTGGPSLDTAMEAVEWGALQYLVKPVSAETLLETAARAVKLGRLARLKRQALTAAGFEHLVGDRAGLEAAFSRALEGLFVACQPIVRAADASLFANEALLRTSEPVFPHPGAFLDAAEQLGRLPDVGRGVRAAVARLLERDALPGVVFINLHPTDLADAALADPSAPLSRFASRVVLEVTERARLEATPDVPARIQALRAMGYRVALDDLGAGYAGLTSFAALSPEIVKIDMSLIRGLDADPLRQKLVTSLAGLCRDLGIVVVAEGIETEAERDASVRCGCELLQGFLLGRPRPMTGR
jgi:EAL domain-containing protein (putative c-di-GMP-specific phosphodiesterase class I)